MIDKGQYASHGTFIKKMNQNFLAKWNKPTMAVIHPEPSAKPRVKPINHLESGIKINAKTFDTKFKFQQNIKIKPLNNELIQPFLYIEKVYDKNKKKEEKKKVKLNPFITSKVVQKKQFQSTTVNNASAPPGYSNLFEYEIDRKNIADLIFQKMLESDIDNVKNIFLMWNKDQRRNLTQDINIVEQEFVDFIKELVPNKVSSKQIKHFFEHYHNKATKDKPKKGKQKKEEENNKQSNLKHQISIRAFAFNYSKYKKAQTQITNIMSEKAMKDRYVDLKKYLGDYLAQYRELKDAMNGIKNYEETLRQHFQRIYDGYVNPYAHEIQGLKKELEKPIVKYDKEKKQMLENKIQNLETENNNHYGKLTQDFNQFMESYESSIVKNHDLFFTKRTVAHLLWPVLEHHPYITRDLIQEQVGFRQDEKQRYLQCLSDIVVQMDQDKKHISEDCFTLGEIVQMVNMKYRKRPNEEEQAFTVKSLKKIIKEIKRQFLRKNNLSVQNFDAFPADQQIPLQILHTCFEMECTKVLFKNQIWNELLLMIPERTVLSRLHQLKIDANTCMEYLMKYFKKLDERAQLELNKSKEISLLVENANNQTFGNYSQVINKVMMNVDFYVDGADEEAKEEIKSKKKVGFADLVDAKLAVDRGQKMDQSIFVQETDQIANRLIKLIHTGGKQQDLVKGNQNKLKVNPSLALSFLKHEQPFQEEQHNRLNEPIPENLTMLKTLAKSYFEPQAMNTNAFDIRFYEKLNEESKKNGDPSQNEQVVALGTSMLLMGAPRPDEIQGKDEDPLRISRFLLKNIDEDVKVMHQKIKHKDYENNIEEGINHTYFRDKIKFQNKPTKFDSEGKSKYSVLMPVGYYESYIVGQNVADEEKWYLRPHHVETLTENPLSKKDNVIHTEYQSKLEKLGLKKRPDEFVIEANVKRKQDLIGSLQQRIQSLKGQVVKAKRSNEIAGSKVPTTTVDQYYSKITENQEDKDLQVAAYEGMLFDLRRKQRDLLNNYRQNQSKICGEPNNKWWQRKDKNFNQELRKDRELVSDRNGVHRLYVQKLKNNEIY